MFIINIIIILFPLSPPYFFFAPKKLQQQTKNKIFRFIYYSLLAEYLHALITHLESFSSHFNRLNGKLCHNELKMSKKGYMKAILNIINYS